MIKVRGLETYKVERQTECSRCNRALKREFPRLDNGEEMLGEGSDSPGVDLAQGFLRDASSSIAGRRNEV